MISQTTLADIIERDTGTPAEQPNVFIAEPRHNSDVAASDPTMPQLVIGVDKSGATIAGGSADDTIVPDLRSQSASDRWRRERCLPVQWQWAHGFDQ
jgi:hypothetical protein